MSPMRVLIAPDRFGSLTGVEAARTIAAGWRERAPHVQVETVPQSAGGPGFLGAVEAATGGTLEMVPLAARGVPVVSTLRQAQDTALRQAQDTARSTDGAVYVEAAEVVGADKDSAALGELLGRLAEGSAARVVIGVGGMRTLDGGRGLVERLGGDPASARERIAGLEIVVAADTDRVLLGLQGACASAVQELGLSSEQAQEAERGMGEWVDQVRRTLPPPTDLLSGLPQRLDRLPGAGAGGGAAFALAALGATIRPGPELVAEVTGLAGATRGAAVAVTATTSYDWTVLQHSVAEHVARAAAATAVPAILLAHDVQVGRRETMSLGFAGSYSVLPSGRIQPPGEVRSAHEDEQALRALARRVAGTWTPPRH